MQLTFGKTNLKVLLLRLACLNVGNRLKSFSTSQTECKLLTFLSFVFTLLWFPMQSYQDYKLGVGTAGKYKIALNSDDKKFDGYGNIDPNSEYFASPGEWDGRPNSLMVYIPSRVALVLCRCD